MIIENNIQDGIDFFHMGALSSAVPMKVDCDLQPTLMGSSLYRLFGNEAGQGYERAKSRTIFRNFVNTHASVAIGQQEIAVRFQKLAHNPLLLRSDFENIPPFPGCRTKKASPSFRLNFLRAAQMLGQPYLMEIEANTEAIALHPPSIANRTMSSGSFHDVFRARLRERSGRSSLSLDVAFQPHALKTFQHSSQISCMSGFIRGHLLQFDLQFSHSQPFRHFRVLGIIRYVLKFHVQVQFDHGLQIGWLIELPRIGGWISPRSTITSLRNLA
jgi:hypothetical protein